MVVGGSVLLISFDLGRILSITEFFPVGCFKLSCRFYSSTEILE